MCSRKKRSKKNSRSHSNWETQSHAIPKLPRSSFEPSSTQRKMFLGKKPQLWMMQSRSDNPALTSREETQLLSTYLTVS